MSLMSMYDSNKHANLTTILALVSSGGILGRNCHDHGRLQTYKIG